MIERGIAAGGIAVDAPVGVVIEEVPEHGITIAAIGGGVEDVQVPEVVDRFVGDEALIGVEKDQVPEAAIPGFSFGTLGV